MKTELKSQYRFRSSKTAIDGTVAEGAKTSLGWRRHEVFEWGLFWAFVAGLAWTPFWIGSNDILAWGINAVLFAGLAIIYEISILGRGEGHPVAIKELGIPAALFAAVVVWIVVQNATWTASSLHHPIWAMTADALARPIEGSISVNRDLTTLALVRLITAASVLWIAVQLCRSPARANYLVQAVTIIISVYAAYGLISFAWTPGAVRWFENTSVRGAVTSTFGNRNHFATYAGIGLIAACGLILRLYRRELTTRGGSLQFRIASIIEATGQKGAILLGCAFLLLVALLLTGSRGGIIATGLGLLVLGALSFARREASFAGQRQTLVFGAFLAVAAFLAFGDVFVGEITERGLFDENRKAVYMITLRSITNAPLLGYGYGTFMDVFPMFRDRSVSGGDFWEQAHNTYLEVFQGLGLVFGSMLVASVVLLVLRCLKGAATRQEGVTVPCVAASVAFLVGVHALADFSLQIQAVALTFMALLGAGVAQSKSSRLALND
jgi:O-antigen ligase